MAETDPDFDWTTAQPVEEGETSATLAATTFGQRSMPAPTQGPINIDTEFDWKTATLDEPFDPTTAQPLSDAEEQQFYQGLEVASRDPQRILTNTEHSLLYDHRQQQDDAVSRFFEGASDIPGNLAQIAADATKETAQNFAENYVPQRLQFYKRNIATGMEAGRKIGVQLLQLFDWGQNKAADIVDRGRANDVKMREIAAQVPKTGDERVDGDNVMAAIAKAREGGVFNETPFGPNKEEDYDRYLRQNSYNRSHAGTITEATMGGNTMTFPEEQLSFMGEKPMQSAATVGAMILDPTNAIPLGAGVLSKLRILRRLSRVTGMPLPAVERGLASFADRMESRGARVAAGVTEKTGLSKTQQLTTLGAASAGAGLLAANTDGMDAVLLPVAALASVPLLYKAVGGTIRKTSQAAGVGAQVVREMRAGNIGSMRQASAEDLLRTGAVPDAYADFMRPYATGVESTLGRTAKNPNNSEITRKLSRLADNTGVTQAFRFADDAVSSGVAATLASTPFALLAPDAEQAGAIVGGAATLGTIAGPVTGAFARRQGAVNADIARMLIDVHAVNGDVPALLSLGRDRLGQIAGMQGVVAGKTDFVTLRASDYRANVDLRKSGNETKAGVFIEKASDGTARIFINLGEPVSMDGKVRVRDRGDGVREVRVRGADGRTEFIAVPKNRRVLVNDGDAVKAGQQVVDYLPATRSIPHEIAHAILTSDILDGDIRTDMQNYVTQVYGEDGIQARGQEYIGKIVDGDIMFGTHEGQVILTPEEAADVRSGKRTMSDVMKGKPVEAAERDALIAARIDEYNQRSRENGGNDWDWARNEVIAEQFAGESQGIDFRAIRRGGPKLMESALATSARVLEALGAKFDRTTGKPLDNPSVLFRDNPLFQSPVLRKRMIEHVRAYNDLLTGLEEAGKREARGTKVSVDGTPESAARSPHMKQRADQDQGGRVGNEFLYTDETGKTQWRSPSEVRGRENARTLQAKTLYNPSRIVSPTSTEFGLRRTDSGRTVISGPTLPAQFDHFVHFPKWFREFARTLEASRERGGTFIADYNAIGDGKDGTYRVRNRGDIRAILREVGFIGWEMTRNNHLKAVLIDLNAFRAATMKAINNGELGIFNNDMSVIEADLRAYLDNHKNGRPGETAIGQAKRDMLNGLIGTGTAVQRKANPLYSDLNPRGSVRSFRLDRFNDLTPTGREGLPFDYDKINSNRMPSALPQSGMAMPDGLVRGERADIPLNPRARQAAFISDRGEVRATGRATHFETNEDLGPDFLAIGAGHLGEDGFFRFGSQSMDEAMGDSPETSSAAAARFNQSAYDQGRRPSSMLEEPPGLERPAARGQAMADVGGQQTMVQRNPAGDYEPLGMLKKQKNGNWAVYTAPMMAANKDGTQTMLPPSKLAEYPTEAKARARAEKEFFTSLPLQDAKQYLGARERQAITEAQQRIAEVAKNNPEAARLEVTRDDRGLPKVGLIEDADGNPVLDARGNQKFGAIYRKAQYDLRKAPGLSKDEARAVQQAADLMEADARRGQANPAIAKGIGWYGRMRGWLQQAYGATIELFGQLLGATSARTPVDTNFIQAREALQIFGRGGYDDLLGRFDAFVMQKKADADSGKMEADWRKKGGKGTFKLQDEYRKQVNKFDEVPLRGNGKKYNANSTKVLHALYGNWITQTKGPKTPNFAGNLTGRTFKATIDVWAARNLRRLLYEGKSKRWRILPEQEQGVADADFFFGQKVYDEVGRRMGIPTDDLQALQWFNEKDIWETNDWTDKTGAEKSSFDKEAGKLSVDRYQVGLTTFQDAAGFDPAVQRAELTAFRNSVRAQEGLEAARVTESEGLYGNVVEPTFDAEFSVNRKGEVSPSIEPIIRQAIDTANRNKQNDVFISAVVEEAHPNARPMVEVGFKSAASRAEIDAVTAVFRGAGIDGFTVARNERGDVLGIRAQYVPEISARYDTLDHLDPAQFAVKSGDWVDRARSAIASLENQDNVSYRKEGHVSTNVYGIEEYGSVTPADILRSNARQELGRRRAILAAGTR